MLQTATRAGFRQAHMAATQGIPDFAAGTATLLVNMATATAANHEMVGDIAKPSTQTHLGQALTSVHTQPSDHSTYCYPTRYVHTLMECPLATESK
jgi:hypothetical protein